MPRGEGDWRRRALVLGGSFGRGSEHPERSVQAVLTAPVGFVVGFGRNESDQLVQVVVGSRKNGPAGVGAHTKHQPFAVRVQQLQLTQRRGRLVADDDLVDGTGNSELAPAQLVGRVRSVADDSLIIANAATPLNRRRWLAPHNANPPPAGPVGRSAPAVQRGYPAGAGCASGGGPHNIAQVVRQAACGPRRVFGQVQEVMQVGDQHCAKLYRPQFHRAAPTSRLSGSTLPRGRAVRRRRPGYFCGDRSRYAVARPIPKALASSRTGSPVAARRPSCSWRSAVSL